jgi:hypothetical protein
MFGFKILGFFPPKFCDVGGVAILHKVIQLDLATDQKWKFKKIESVYILDYLLKLIIKIWWVRFNFAKKKTLIQMGSLCVGGDQIGQLKWF